MIQLQLLAAAEADLAAAVEWYEARLPGLGDSFVQQVEAVLAAILDYPAMHQAIHGDTRRALVRRFPYLVVYRTRSEVIDVIGVLPCRADPQALAARVANASGVQ